MTIPKKRTTMLTSTAIAAIMGRVALYSAYMASAVTAPQFVIGVMFFDIAREILDRLCKDLIMLCKSKDSQTHYLDKERMSGLYKSPTLWVNLLFISLVNKGTFPISSSFGLFGHLVITLATYYLVIDSCDNIFTNNKTSLEKQLKSLGFPELANDLIRKPLTTILNHFENAIFVVGLALYSAVAKEQEIKQNDTGVEKNPHYESDQILKQYGFNADDIGWDRQITRRFLIINQEGFKKENNLGASSLSLDTASKLDTGRIDWMVANGFVKELSSGDGITESDKKILQQSKDAREGKVANVSDAIQSNVKNPAEYSKYIGNFREIMKPDEFERFLNAPNLEGLLIEK